MMGKTLGPVQLGQPILDFGQEDKLLYRVIDALLLDLRLKYALSAELIQFTKRRFPNRFRPQGGDIWAISLSFAIRVE
jgi:hypothetical protein